MLPPAAPPPRPPPPRAKPRAHPEVAPPNRSAPPLATPTNLNSTPPGQSVIAPPSEYHRDRPPDPSPPYPPKDQSLTFSYPPPALATTTPAPTDSSMIQALQPPGQKSPAGQTIPPPLLPPFATNAKSNPMSGVVSSAVSDLILGCSSSPIIANNFFSRIQKIT